MKNLFIIYCVIIFNPCTAMEDRDDMRMLELQQRTWPLRDSLRKLKNVIAIHRCKLSREHQESCKCREGMVTSHLNNVLKQLDHVIMDASNQNFSQIDKHLSKANDHLELATRELLDYKNMVKEKTGIDIDSRAKI